MALRIGSRVGHFEVIGLLGAGGMGQVYRATDTKLRRDVALKILPDAFAADPERRARFEREAHALAALNHSGIAAIHGIEEFDGALALVLELVPGLTLEDRIARGAMPVDQVLRVALGIAGAVEAAHERGIVHRDLKPANIKVQNDGTVKVLDFGLAKALSQAGGHLTTPASEAPTETIADAATAPGLILGTASYMSPEQARSEPIDERTDVWAFGCILFEMLTGKAPFGRGRLTDTLANVLKEEPDYSTLPPDTPPLVQRLVRRCLEKDRRERLRHIGDARADLRDSLEVRNSASASGATSSVGAEGAQRAPVPRRGLLVAALVGTAAIAGLAAWLVASRAAPRLAKPETISYEIADVSYPGFNPRNFAVSPDGTRIVHPSSEGMILRSLRHTDRVQDRWGGLDRDVPFFSPDGEWLGFFDSWSQLSRIPAQGGAPIVISVLGADKLRWLGASWGAGDLIVVASTFGLHRVAAAGGQPELLIAPDPARGELQLTDPEILPGGRAVLFTVVHRDPKAAPQVSALDLESLERKTVLTDGAGPRYLPDGRLVYVAQRRLHSVAFDVGSLEARGDPVMVLDQDVERSNFDLADDGTLVYQPAAGARGGEVLMWVDRSGHQELLSAPAGGWVYPRISPDGKRIASDRWVPGEGRDIYVWELDREILSRLTDDRGEDLFPHWSADGTRVFFSSNRTGVFNLYSSAADGTGSDERVLESAAGQMLMGLTPDGTQLLVGQVGSGGFDLAAVDVDEPRETRILLATAANEHNPSVSPDGRWLAYSSDDGGWPEVYVGPFPDLGSRRWKISSGGGSNPLWSRTGDEIFFRGPSGNLMAAQVTLNPSFVPGKVVELFPNLSGDEFRPGIGGRRFEVSPLDGRFLMTKDTDPTRGNRLVVLLNWGDELEAKVPVR